MVNKQVVKELKTKRGIYKILNKVNGKFYIGSSINIIKRWWEHRKRLRLGIHQNIHLQRAWNEYGEGSFVFEVYEGLAELTDKEIAIREKELIELFFDNGKNCYNISKETDRPDSSLNKKAVWQLNKETKEFIKEWPSAADIERELGLDANCIYNACKGRLVTFGGYRWIYKDLKLSSKYRQKEGQHGGHKKKKVVCLTDGKIYDSIAEAASAYGIKYNNVSSVCAKRRKHTKKLIFEYYEGNDSSDQVKDKKENNFMTELNEDYKCKMCGVDFQESRKLASHLQFFHKIKTEDYTISYMLSGVRPSCGVENCVEPVRYVSFGFKRYCKAHSNLAESDAGKRGSIVKKQKNLERLSDITPDINTVCFESSDRFDEFLYGSTEKLKINGTVLSSVNIMKLTTKEREKFVEPLFQWFRMHGFPYKRMFREELVKDFENLCKEDVKITNDIELSNKNYHGSDLFWEYQANNFCSVKTRTQVSMLEAFSDDDKLRSVIRNRLGITYKETFNITGAMLRQGFRSSAACALISIFNPLIAKHVWNHAPENGIVYDYSMGFGQRMIGALSTNKGLTYIATDPWESVVNQNNTIASFLKLNDKVKLFCEGAENFCPNEYKGKVDLVFSSPPYFDKEIYDNGTQKVAKNSKNWFLNVWWTQVVKNSFELLKKEGIFVLNMFDKLIEPMHKIIIANGFTLIKKEGILLSKSHLTKKENDITKLEPIWFYKK